MNFLKDYRLWLSAISVLILGAVSGINSTGSASFYNQLILPSFAPPAWLFGPAWTILYLLIGSAFYFMFIEPKTKERTVMISLFIIQLILNLIWTPIFFVLQNNLLSVIVILTLAIVLFFFQLYLLKHKRISMWLMGPYFLWVSFATILNFAIFFLN